MSGQLDAADTLTKLHAALSQHPNAPPSALQKLCDALNKATLTFESECAAAEEAAMPIDISMDADASRPTTLEMGTSLCF